MPNQLMQMMQAPYTPTQSPPQRGHMPIASRREMRNVEMELARIERQTQIEIAREQATTTVRAMHHQGEALEHMVAMQSAMQLVDMGRALAGDDPAKQHILAEIAQMYLDTRRACFLTRRH